MSARVVHLFDAQAAREARDEAVARVDEHAEAAWRLAALDAVYFLAHTRPEFTTDAVWWLLDRAGVEPPHEERALGAVIQRASRHEWIERTERVHESVRVECHRNPKRVWRSLLWTGRI